VAEKRDSTSLAGWGLVFADITISWRRERPAPNKRQGPGLTRKYHIGI
jgi:hypothetical protein